MRKTTLVLVLAAALLPAALHAQDWRTLVRSRAYGGEKSLDVDVEYGAGQLRIQPAADNVLYRANMRYDADVFKPELSFSDNALHVGVGNGEFHGRRNMKGGSLELLLGTKVPIDLELKFGAAEARLELGGIRISKLEVSTGASDTKLNFSKPNPVRCESAVFQVGAARFEATGLGNLNVSELSVSGGVGEVLLDFTGSALEQLSADIQMGLGSLTLRVPRGVGLKVQKDGVLSGFDSEGLTKRGNVYYSQQYERARRKVDIKLDAAFGSIKVLWVNAQ